MANPEEPPGENGPGGGRRVRSMTIRGNPAKIDDGVAYVRDEVLPSVQSMDGVVGLSMMAERETGRCIVATAWADEQALRATAEQARPLGERLLQTLGGQDIDVRQWEVAVLHRERPAGDGARAQVTWARIQPTRVDGLLDAFRTNLLPRLQELPGFCSCSMLVDQRNGRGVAVTSYEDRDAFERTRKHARLLREQFAQAVGAGIVDVAEMDLALAHLRVPETA